MKAQQLRTLIISKASLVDVQTALDLLRSGAGLTAGQSGTVAYDSIANLELVGYPRVVWDGTKYTVFLYVSAG